MSKRLVAALVPSRTAGFTGSMLTILVAGCTLGEVTASPGGDVPVVEGHLQANSLERQYILLHRSMRDGAVHPEPGATVTITPPEGMPVRLVEYPAPVCAELPRDALEEPLEVEVSCYATSSFDDLLVRPGMTYELEVETTSGERVRGRTTVPGNFRGRRPDLPAHSTGSACRMEPRTNLELIWSQSEGSWSYLANVEILGLRTALAGTGIEAPDRVELTGLSISQTDTTLVIPRELGLFEFTNVESDLLVYLQDGFPPGVTARLRVSALDRNYVNAIRGGSFNPSGAIRVSSVVGDGVGVFGSYVPRDLFVVVDEDATLPAC